MTDDKAAARKAAKSEYNRRYREKNQERLNEYYRQWRQRNLEYVRAYDRERTANDPERKRKGLEHLQAWTEANPERAQEAQAEYRQANREKINEYGRQWKRENAEHKRLTDAEWRKANPARVRAMAQRAAKSRKARGYVVPGRVRRRQITAEWWHKQDGRCYLCKESLPVEAAVLDHDHRCCPADAFCNHCIRGAACNQCNTAIGLMQDDPDRMESIARVLRSKLAELDERLATKSEQLTLDDVS